MHHYSGISQAEKLAITELLRHENLCAKKCSIYQNQVQDPQIKSALTQMQNIKQQHSSALNNMLQQAGLTGGGTQMV
ncbi:MAG: hypothetical protein C4575_11665 [Desulforudis sp.]|jgi:hypothetical protein|nr:hypothetical protein [Clostridia bacterium]MDQ7791196.1 hypothetical protein [Clostridia bacterium]RJX17767.1 MAG: hypothetical protein C4575_11665 [Desulforudis sp.]